jgi:hypothetical protein
MGTQQLEFRNPPTNISLLLINSSMIFYILILSVIRCSLLRHWIEIGRFKAISPHPPSVKKKLHVSFVYALLAANTLHFAAATVPCRAIQIGRGVCLRLSLSNASDAALETVDEDDPSCLIRNLDDGTEFVVREEFCRRPLVPGIMFP